MIGIPMYTTILTLHKQGKSQREIAKLTDRDRKTIRRIIFKYNSLGIELPTPYQKESKVIGWHEEIIKLLEKDLSFVRINEELQSLGFSGSYSSLTRYLRKIKIRNNICIRFNTLPGDEAQVDFGEIGRRYNPEGKLKKAYIFNMRLSYSRKDYYEIVFDQKVNTWIQCHINAFKYFEGVPRVIKLDNLKSAIIIANFYEPIYQEQYKRFADHYGFLPAPCRVRKPQEKGKVENGIKYVSNNFFAGRSFSNNREMVEALESWNRKSNNRIHGTTKKKPAELFNNEELATLIKLPEAEFDLSSWHRRKVAKDCHISLDNNYYSVPSKYAGTEVEISLGIEIVRVYAQGEMVAMHNRPTGKGLFITNRSHWPEYKLFYPESGEYQNKCVIEMQEIGEYGGKMLSFIREQQKNKDWPRTIKGILHLKKSYGNEVVNKACMRALHYGIGSYSKIKEIIKNNCYDLPLPVFGGEDARII
jgi:transposase